MNKQVVQFEISVAEKVFRFVCDCDSQFTHVKEALCQLLKEVSNIEDNIKSQMAAQEAEKAKQATVTVEEPQA